MTINTNTGTTPANLTDQALIMNKLATAQNLRVQIGNLQNTLKTLRSWLLAHTQRDKSVPGAEDGPAALQRLGYLTTLVASTSTQLAQTSTALAQAETLDALKP
jgi:hypothetical protein